MPEKDPENIKWMLTTVIGLTTGIWGVLSYRVFDISKTISTKVSMKVFNDTMEAIRKEAKEDFRYHEEQVRVMLKDLAKDLKAEIGRLSK